ncbi:hypothetical protein F652_1602 [Enterobacteriaceae bacterium bta3-1]|nr:hypothetical protein F652_1602 [Enterobacteriaceae bacterium bta3-1]
MAHNEWALSVYASNCLNGAFFHSFVKKMFCDAGLAKK